MGNPRTITHRNGFGETPADPSQWFDTAVMNFAVAGLMASTPMIVHGILSGTLASVGAGVLQTALSGTGAMLAGMPMRALTKGENTATRGTIGTVTRAGRAGIQLAKTQLGMPPTPSKSGGSSGPPKPTKGK